MQKPSCGYCLIYTVTVTSVDGEFCSIFYIQLLIPKHRWQWSTTVLVLDFNAFLSDPLDLILNYITVDLDLLIISNLKKLCSTNCTIYWTSSKLFFRLIATLSSCPRTIKRLLEIYDLHDEPISDLVLCSYSTVSLRT